MAGFYKFSLRFYIIILALTIPFYFLLYGASGHQINIPMEDLIWIITVFLALGTTTLYLLIMEKERSWYNTVKVLVALTSLGTFYFGLKVFLSMIDFKFGDDISFVIQALGYTLPLIFIISNVMIFIGLFKKFE